MEKIAAIKAKRLAKKRTTIKSNDYSDTLGVVGSDFRAILDYDVDLTKDIMSRERQWRTRTTVLQSNGKVSKKIKQVIENEKLFDFVAPFETQGLFLDQAKFLILYYRLQFLSIS